MRPLRSRLDQQMFQTMISALIIFRLDYCNSLLSDLPSSTLAPLQRVLHTAARLTLKLKICDHISPALKSLHWLPIKHRVTFKLCSLVHLALSNKSPSYRKTLLIPVSSLNGRSSLRSASDNKFAIPSSRLRIRDRAFSIAGPRAWNSLPSSLRHIENTLIFKKKIKAFLFNLAFPPTD